MAEQMLNTEGEVSQPSSQNGDNYADYYELNAEASEGEGNTTQAEPNIDSTPVDNKAEVKQPEANPELSTEKPQHVPNWKKKIDKQTKQIAELRDQLNKVKESAGQKPNKYTRDNFVNDEEYEEWKDKSVTQRIRDELKQEMLETELRRVEQERAYEENESFKQSWSQKVNKNYEPNSKEYQEYIAISRDQKYLASLPEAVHDYVESTDFGPLMLHVLYYRPDLVDMISRSKSIAQTRTLMKLESEIESAFSGKASEQKQTAPTVNKVSKAPAPIGQVGVSGVTSSDEDDATAYAKYIKQNISRR
jgi:hypothetical protein